jgi:hypothetical protein
MTGGLGMEDDHFGWHVSGTYNAANKKSYFTDTQHVVNPHGNIRFLTASAFGRTTSAWLYGTECEYVSLRTTNYDKTSWDCAVGGGHDWMHVTRKGYHGPGEVASMRLIVTYKLPLQGWNKLDTENGFNFHFTLPSPMDTRHHIFFDEHTFLGWICDPKCGHDGSTSMGVLFRF